MRRSVRAPKMVEQHRTVIHVRLDSESVAVEDEAGDRNVDRGCRMPKGIEDVLRDGPMVTRLLVIWLTLGLRQIVCCDGVQNGWFHGLVPNYIVVWDPEHAHRRKVRAGVSPGEGQASFSEGPDGRAVR